jgi:hypothetical protein
MSFKLDIFKVLNEISNGNVDYLDSLPEEQAKQFSAYLTMLWIRGATTDSDAHIVLTNELVNPYVFSLSKHPKLLYKLLCTANGFGGKQFYRFNKKNKSISSESIEIIKQKYGYSNREAMGVLPLFTEEDIMEIAQDIGYNIEK